MMQQSTIPSNRRQKVSAIRDFPPGCGTQFSGSGNVGIRKLVSAKRTFPPFSDSKVKPLRPEDTVELLASHQSKNRRLSESFATEKMRNVVAPRDERRSNQARPNPVKQQTNQTTKVVSSAREKVLNALRDFKTVFRELDRDKAAGRGESKTGSSRIDYQTRSVLMAKNKQVNGEKRIGVVPGIEVEDEFQYKSEMNVIGLHFSIMGGIDYMNRGELKLATSIVASEGYGYNDKFESDVVIYTGEGGSVMNRDQNIVEDQKLVKGNLALANSMKAQNEVRVIRGLKRLDQKGKHYVYDGLYLVKDYWREKGPLGNMLFKFKLCRISGQPPINWKKHIY